MQERSLRKSAAIGGILFVVLLVITIVMTFPAPAPDKSATKIVKWYSDNRGLVLTSGVLAGLTMVAFLWFLGYLHHMVSSVAGATRALSSILLASGIATITIATVTILPSLALAVTAGRPDVTPSEGVVRMLNDISNLSFTLISMATAVLLVALGLLLADGALSPRWATWVAYVGAAVSLIGGAVAVYPSKSGKPNPGGLLALLGLVLFLVTVAGISVELWRDRVVAEV